jgi:hypothetical protein
LTSYIYIACRLYRYFIYLFSIKFPNPCCCAQTTSSSSHLSEWYTVNVTGVAGAPFASLSLPLAGNTEGPEEDNGESNDDENSNDNDDNNDNEEDSNNDGSDSDGDGDSFFGDSFFD